MTDLYCSDKTRLSSKAAAVTFGSRMARKHGVAVKPYRCRLCKGWHLTTDIDGRGRRKGGRA